MRLNRFRIEVRHQSAFQLSEKSDHIAGFIVKEPRHTIAARTVQAAVRGKKAKRSPPLVEVRCSRVLKSRNIMAPEREAAHRKGKSSADRLGHGRIACKAVSAPMHRELLSARRRTSRKQHSFLLPLHLF